MILLAATLACAPVATDGDSIRLCSGERIRLAAIDAPEMSRCRRGRVCTPGDPIASRGNLRRLINGRERTIRRTGRDRYGRTIACVSAGGRDLSHAQVRGTFAVERYGKLEVCR